MHQVDTLLLKSERLPETSRVLDWLRESQLSISLPVACASTPAAENGLPAHYLYLHFKAQQTIDSDTMSQLHKLWHNLGHPPAQLSRLQKVLDLDCASSGQATQAHYVVETDPEQGWDDEISKWYEQEHLPDLASVPGTITARRFINLDHSPRSFACYDLTSPAVLSTPEWLAVRGTAWSDICRPHFTNTLRTMFTSVSTMIKN